MAPKVNRKSNVPLPLARPPAQPHHTRSLAHSPAFSSRQTPTWRQRFPKNNKKADNEQKNCPPKHENPLKAPTVLTSGLLAFKYCMCCIDWTKKTNKQTIKKSSHASWNKRRTLWKTNQENKNGLLKLNVSGCWCLWGDYYKEITAQNKRAAPYHKQQTKTFHVFIKKKKNQKQHQKKKPHVKNKTEKLKKVSAVQRCQKKH